jgi:hypothetical protein
MKGAANSADGPIFDEQAGARSAFTNAPLPSLFGLKAVANPKDERSGGQNFMSRVAGMFLKVFRCGTVLAVIKHKEILAAIQKAAIFPEITRIPILRIDGDFRSKPQKSSYKKLFYEEDIHARFARGGLLHAGSRR